LRGAFDDEQYEADEIVGSIPMKRARMVDTIPLPIPKKRARMVHQIPPPIHTPLDVGQLGIVC
jgi:hypothetical protein